MGKSAKLVIILTIISMISGGALAFVYSLTSPKMQEVALQKQQDSIFEVLPGIESYREYKNDKNILIFEGLDDSGSIKGLAFVSEGAGFQGKIRLMVGLDLHSKQITGYKVLEHQETPGLGARITEGEFKDQFSNKSWADPFKVKDDIIPITGATISSKAVTDLMKKSVNEVIDIYGGEA